MKLGWKREDGKPMTLDDLREFVKVCDAAGMPGGTEVCEVRVTMRGQLKSMAAES